MSPRQKRRRSPAPASRPSVWLQPPAVWAALGLIVLLAYGNTLDNAFVYDDIPYIVENAVVRGGMSPWAAFERPYPPHLPHFSLYRPLPELVFAACWRIGLLTSDRAALGLPPRADAWPFHAVNLLLHWLVCGLMFHFWAMAGRLARRRGWPPEAAAGDDGAPAGVALAAALIFAAHPVHVENVAALVGAVDLLAAALAMGAAILWLRAGEGGGARHSMRWGAAACLLLALFSKENAIVIPLLLALAGAALTTRSGAGTAEAWGRRALAWAPVMAVVVMYLAIRLGVLGVLTSSEEIRYFKPGEEALRWMSAPIAFLLNIKLVVWPIELCADYNYPVRFAGDWFIAAPESWLNPWVLAGGAALGAWGVALWALWGRHRPAALGLAWFGAALLPTSHLVPFGDLLGERFLYLPSVGLIYAMVAVMVDIVWPRLHGRERQGGPVLLVIGALVVALLAGRTIARNEVWSSPRAFWMAVLRDAPENREAPYGLAHALGGERAEALERGNALLSAGRTDVGQQWLERAAALEDEAIAAYEQAIQRTPDYLTAYLNLANLLFESREPRPGPARELLGEMIRRAENRPEMRFAAWGRLGQHWVDEGRWEEAREAFERAVEIEESPEALVLLGVARANLGDLAGAEAAWRRALDLDPGHANARENLRRLEARNQRGEP